MALQIRPPATHIRTFEYGGFDFTCSEGPIGDKTQYQTLEESLDTGAVPLPEMVFPQNSVVIRHTKTGVVLKFDAESALRCWHSQQLRTHGDRGPGRVAEVDPERFDWTFATDYEGSLSSPAGSGTDSISAVHSPCGLPMPLLQARTPILFFASCVLYASDLDDRGYAECEVKVRVMEGFWLLLLRSWARIDRVSIAVRDTRYLCRLCPEPVDSPGVGGIHVLKDVQVRGEGWDDLQAALSEQSRQEQRREQGLMREERQPSGGAAYGAVATVMPSPSHTPRSVGVHPVALASILARAQRIGMSVDEHSGRIVPPGMAHAQEEPQVQQPAGLTPHTEARPARDTLPATATDADADAEFSLETLRLAISADEAFAALQPREHSTYTLTLS